MAKYEQYAEYKDSGVKVLGSIPTQWKTSKLAYTFLKANAGEVIDKTYWGSGKEVLYTCNKTPLLSDYKDFPKEKRTTKDDLLLTRNGTPYVHKPIEGSIYSNVVQRITLSAEFDRNYLTYCLGNSALSLKGYGVSIESFNFETWKSMEFATPSMREQKQVVNFLDHETGQIDTLIEKQQTLIHLLKEKRQAVISHAVTKGLNPDAPMKDSGVEWLGEVPEHWEVGSLGYYATLETGATPSRANPKYWNGNIPWVKTGEVKYDTIYDTEEKVTDIAVLQTSIRVSPVGTLLMAMYGQGITRGRVAVLGLPAAYNQACVAITVDHRVWNEYLKWFFIAGYHAIRDGGNETSQMNLNADLVGKFKIVVPPKDEQEEITNALIKRLPLFDHALEKANEQIKLMQERRTALISAAVTGKIDVRGWRAAEIKAS